MPFLRYVPEPPLASFVDYIWYHEGPNPSHRRERVLPDGTSELLIDLQHEPQCLFDGEAPKGFRAFRGCWLSGPHSKFFEIGVLPRSCMMGVHFKHGGIAPFAGIPACELADQVVELEALWNRAARDLREALLGFPGPRSKLLFLEKFLLGRLAQSGAASRKSRALVAAIQRLACHPEGTTVRQTAEDIGISHKHLISLFREQVGLTPKAFGRVQRFHKTLGAIQAELAPDWADVACRHGFYDQAHLVHEFRAFAGCTPANYLERFRAWLNFLPILDEG